MDVIFTHAVVDMPVFPGHTGNGDNLAGKPLGESGRSHRGTRGHCQQKHHTGLEPDHPQVGTRWEEAEGGHQLGTKLGQVEAVERQDWEGGYCQPGRLGQQHVPVPLQPCAGSLPPSFGPSIPFGFL